MAQPKTRTQTEKYLVGNPTDKICGARLPSTRQALQYFFHQHDNLKLTVRVSARNTVRAVMPFWERALLPTTSEKHAIERLEKIFNEWTSLKKNIKRGGAAQQRRKAEFMEKLDRAFDIKHQDAEDLITIDEDRKFLRQQLGTGRDHTSIGTVDMKLAAFEKRRAERLSQEMERQERALAEKRKAEETITYRAASSSSSSTRSSSFEEKHSPSPSSSKTLRLSRPRNIVTKDVAAALDRSKLSDRNAVFTLAAVSKALGHNPEEVSLNRWSIRRNRAKARKESMEEIKSAFTPDVPMTVHWDSKLLEDIIGRKEKQERLPILVSGMGYEQLLDVPSIGNATGENMANAVSAALHDWGLKERVRAMSFDTTASNTGRLRGAAPLLEDLLGRPLLNLACRHHIYEVLLSDVFACLFGKNTTSPDIPLFKRFQAQWKSIARTPDCLQNASTDEETACVLSQNPELKDSAISFARNALAEIHPRDDYRELLQLILLYLGAETIVRIRAPGAMHRSRWMAKTIYGLKVFLLRNQLQLTAREVSQLRALNLFTALVYYRARYTAPSTVEAPRQDLETLKQLAAYRSINRPIATAALKAMLRHTWYLSLENVCLALFDNNVDAATKQAMLEAMHAASADGMNQEERCVRPFLLEDEIDNLSLPGLVRPESQKFFLILGLEAPYLESDPATWTTSPMYLSDQRQVAGLSVINDRAERGVALMKDYNVLLTRNEEQKQALLQVVARPRQQFPGARKGTVCSN